MLHEEAGDAGVLKGASQSDATVAIDDGDGQVAVDTQSNDLIDRAVPSGRQSDDLDVLGTVAVLLDGG